MDPKEYNLDYFKAEGFTRRQCPKCKRHHWSLGEHDTCGEPPCSNYSFFEEPPMKKPYGLHEIREVYLSFFEKHGHGRIPRYPITARWRDDVFFTQASIYDFQPWVINGVVEPPANPLTISQTCVRFNDIDNVGKTGRHFTMFEMIAHHAFNTKDNFIYFKDRTVELCHELLTEELGIDPAKPIYIEEWWEGGGNSGPCFEVLVDGVELATLVFMMYEETTSGRKDLPMQVVDTGYGLERFAWVSQGSPNAYEAIFPKLSSALKSKLNIHIDDEILTRYSLLCSTVDSHEEGAILKVKKQLSEERKIPLHELQEILKPLESLYVLLDHSRALMFLLNDGVVPSNVKDGYFARLLARRSMRAIDSMGLESNLSDIVSKQIDEYCEHFPELEGNRETILELTHIEEKKFERTLDKGRSLVERLEKEDNLDLDALVELYDSHGLDPETVSHFANKEIDIPENFYALVAERHEETHMESGTTDRAIEGGPTELLYYQDHKKGDFEAVVKAVTPEGVVLDATYFYPEGGGQESDKGEINGHAVIFVEKVGTTVIHHIEGDHDLSPGDDVTCQVDMRRRVQLTRQHTATHIINNAARRVLGKHVMQTGAHKSEEVARLDITHYEAVSNDQLQAMERIANDIVLENREITATVMERNEAEGKYGFDLYQGGAVPGRDIRVVNISDWDVEACGGTHLDNTGEVGFVKLIRSRRIQDGVVRLEFTSGTEAVKLIQSMDRDVERIAEKLGCPKNEVLDAFSSHYQGCEKMKDQLKQLKKGEKKATAEELLTESEEVAGVNVITGVVDLPPKEMTALGKSVMSKAEKPSIMLVGSTRKAALLFMSKGVDAVDLGEMISQVAKHIGGRGGGRPDYAQAGGKNPQGVKDALDEAKAIIMKTIGVNE